MILILAVLVFLNFPMNYFMLLLSFLFLILLWFTHFRFAKILLLNSDFASNKNHFQLLRLFYPSKLYLHFINFIKLDLFFHTFCLF